MRIFPAGWRIIALFHGEEDLHRIREEVRSAVYRLPWLSPIPLEDELPIDMDKTESTRNFKLQELSRLVTSEQRK